MRTKIHSSAVNMQNQKHKWTQPQSQSQQSTTYLKHAMLCHPPTIAWIRCNRVAVLIISPAAAAAGPANSALAGRILAVHPAGVACSERHSAAEAAAAGRSPIVAAVAAGGARGDFASHGYVVVAVVEIAASECPPPSPPPPPQLSPRPAFYAWFLGRESSGRLARLAAAFVDVVADSNSGPASLLFRAGPDAGRRLLHVTAKFCGDGECQEACAAYAGRADVAESLGRAFDIRVTGLLLRPGSSLVARADLSGAPRQLALWDNEPPPRGGGRRPLPRGSRAHVTMATAGGTRPVQAGFDLLDGLGWLASPAAATWDTRLGAVSRLGNGSYYLSLAEPLVAPSLFSGQY